MTIDQDNIAITNNPAAQRFEAHMAGQVAVAAYTLAGQRITFTHTQVPEALRGHGIADKLIHAALEYARAEQLEVVPRCPFVAAYLRRHPEYQALVRSGA